MQCLRRLRAGLLAVAFTVGLPAATAWADAAGPTDYRTTIVTIEPATPTIQATIIGGDSFLRLVVERGTTVDVYGYRSEPFIRFLADGTVEENRASASYYASRSRLGSDLPADFDEEAAPDWHVVATNGDYTWHDHRTHWMTNTRPPGKRPGDVILRQSVLMVVDGVSTELVVESVWLASPSTVPIWVGGLAGLAIAAAVGRRRTFVGALPLLDLALLALVIGVWQFTSLPASTGPRPVWWIYPAVALAASVGLAALRRRPAGLAEHALLLLAGVNLAIWGWQRHEGFGKALLATDAPGWLDRVTSAAAISGGAGAAAIGLVALARVIVKPPTAGATPSAT